ncbi:hypothetical protein E7Z59_05460 [Robertkochia marina]|uniref:DUF1761 domain-containing protein n=1 Tax=Robertkochia marina TaxID=1227945 RepID=A0A4S3M4L9_9FLAO|nr:hypothetical protein [Robertkochia marina]THD69775.1 hypothetical protein E7Z59_05460 [Robertkochia marina]TRZ46881.1 hypothetical protein D3A96_04750 [Robertkochia marina]
MINKANLLATLVGTIVMFFLGYLIWGMLTVEFFTQHSLADLTKEPNIMYIFAGNLVMTFVISSLYGKWADGNYSAASGFKFGAMVGLFVGVGMGLLWFGSANMMTLTGHIAEAGLDILFYAVIGAVVGFVYQKATKPALALN